MHELSICQALLTQIDEIARREKAVAISCVTIELGPLCGVEPTLLRAAFTVMQSVGTAAGADLVIESTDIMISCLSCGAKSHALVNRMVCAACGGYRTRVIAGDELRLRSVAMRVAQPLAETSE